MGLYLCEGIGIGDGNMAVEPVDGNRMKLSRYKATCRNITEDIINASRIVAMDQSDDLVKDFIRDLIERRELLLLLDLLFLQYWRGWWGQQLLLLLRELHGEERFCEGVGEGDGGIVLIVVLSIGSE